jgi:hypothetical protein
MEAVRPNKLKLDDLFERKKNMDMLTAKSFNLVLDRVHVRIKTASRQHINNQCCWFVVPEVIIGIPRFDVRACIAYIINELTENGLQVQYTHPNLLFITWKNWVPDYVRDEFKRQTGKNIDGFGNEIKKEEKKSILKTDSKFTPITNYQPTGIYNDDFFRNLTKS